MGVGELATERAHDPGAGPAGGTIGGAAGGIDIEEGRWGG